jgi:hypothetical protein
MGRNEAKRIVTAGLHHLPYLPSLKSEYFKLDG